jgi:hypothetical protein
MSEETKNVSPATPGSNNRKQGSRRFGCLHVVGFMFLAAVVTGVVTFFVVRTYIYPRDFKPVKLRPQEGEVLEAKLEKMESRALAKSEIAGTDDAKDGEDVGVGSKVEAYSESEEDRTIRFTERELNAILARNTDLATKVAIKLSEDLVSARILLPMDEDLPMFGGKTLRVKTGVSFVYEDGKPEIVLRGVTVMGMPLPNAWLGGMKNIDLVKVLEGQGGFWNVVASGIEDLRVEDGQFVMRVKP